MSAKNRRRPKSRKEKESILKKRVQLNGWETELDSGPTPGRIKKIKELLKKITKN